MACTANTNSISLAITAGVLTADIILDPSIYNGMKVRAAGVSAPTNVTSTVTTASVSGTVVAFGINTGPVGPVLLVPSITNPSLDRTMIGIFVARAVGEQVNWNPGSSGVVAFQSSIDSGNTWQTQTQNFYNNVSGVVGYGGHSSVGVFGPLAANTTEPGNTLQFRMYLSCSAGGGTIVNTGDMDCRVFMVNQ